MFIVFTVVTVIPNVTARASPPGPVVQGTTVDLVCEAIGGDTPISFRWTNSGGVAVSPEDTDGAISVTLSFAGDYGTYICTATNAVGRETVDIDLIQAGIIISITNYAREIAMYYAITCY